MNGGDFRVSIDSGRRYVYPDVVVTCGAEELEAGDTLKNPVVLVEVLSASTEHYDPSMKFHAYQKIPSLREYVIVSTETRLVEVLRRVDDGTWSYVSSSLLNAPIELKSIGWGLLLDEVYFKTEVPDSSGADRE